MKHLVVRTDIREKLKDIRIVLVDSNILLRQLDTRIEELLDKLMSDNLKFLLTKDVRLILYNNNSLQTKDIEINNILYKVLNGMGLKDFVNKLCISTGLSASKLVLINSMETDNNLLSKIGFTVSTFDAPLDVRSNSYYVSNLTGTDAFNEIISLIIKSKY